MIFKGLQEGIDAFMARDPAARSRWRSLALLSGPSLADLLPAVPQAVEALLAPCGTFSVARRKAPDADRGSPGRRLVIDHGTGVVIGETSVIGDDVTLYHAVTLSGIAPSVGSSAQIGRKRHPTVEDSAIIGSGAQVLGPITVGVGARVGANAVVTKDVPPGVTAVGIAARVGNAP